MVIRRMLEDNASLDMLKDYIKTDIYSAMGKSKDIDPNNYILKYSESLVVNFHDLGYDRYGHSSGVKCVMSNKRSGIFGSVKGYDIEYIGG